MKARDVMEANVQSPRKTTRKRAMASLLRIGLGLSLSVLVSASLPARVQAKTQEQKLNRVQKVNVERTDLGRSIDIVCDSDPVFTVFRLSDPMRIVIDIARGDVSKLDGPIEIDDGMVGDIAVAQFSDDRNALGRLIIGLDKNYDYEVKGSGSHVRVSVRGEATMPAVAKATKDNKTIASPVAAKTEAKKPEPVAAKTEVAKVETKIETKPEAKVEAKPEAPKPELAKKTEPVKTEPNKVEIAKAEPAKAPAKIEVAQAEPAKVAPAKVEVAKTEAAKVTTVKVEPVKVETAKLEPIKLEPAKVEAPKIEASKPALVKVDAPKVDAPKIETKVEAPKVEVAKAQPAKSEPTVAFTPPAPVERSVHDISNVVVDKSLEHVTVKKTKNGSDVIVMIKGGKPTYEILELEDPPRVVFDFIGVATKLPKSSHWSLGAMGKLRLGVHQDKVRFVLDGSEGLPKYTINFAGGAVRISTEPMPKHAVQEEPIVAEAPVVAPPKVEAKPEPIKVAVAPVAPAPKPEPIKVAEPMKTEPAKVETKPEPTGFVVQKLPDAPKPERIASLDFSKASEGGKLSFIASDSTKLDVDRSIARAPVLILANAELTKDLEKSTDVSRLKTGLLRFTSFNERKGKGGARIIANLATDMNHRTYRDGERLVWEFTPVVAAEPAIAAVTPPPTPAGLQPVAPTDDVKISMKPGIEVAGFSGEAMQIVRSTSTGAAGGKRMSLDVRGAELLNVLRYISEVSGENIVAGDDVTGRITIRLRNVSWEQALDVALKTKGFGRVRQGSIIRVAPLKKLQEEKEQELARMKAEEQVAPTFVRLIPVNYANAKDVLTQLTPLLTKDRGKATVDERTNTIIAEDLPDTLNKLENLAKRLDTQTPQVLIEARIVEANTSHVRDIGIQWGGSTLFSPATGNATGLAFPNVLGFSGGADDTTTNNTGTANPSRYAVNLPSPVGTGAGGSVGMIFGNAANTGLLSLRLSALENNGSVRIISAPKVTTLDNVRAKISQGVSIPISVTSAAGVNTRFVDAFLSLEVKPHVTQDGSITMEIKAAKNEPDFARTGASGDPTISTKVAETQVLVKDGDTTVIGGIYTRNSSTTFNEVPFLSKIPVLGWLFKRKREEDSRAELLVFITPRIVNRQQSSVSSGGF